MTSSYKWRLRSETILLTGPSRQFVGIFHLSQIVFSPEVYRPITDIPEMDIPEMENELEVEVCIVWCIATRTNTTMNITHEKIYYNSQWCNKASVDKIDI